MSQSALVAIMLCAGVLARGQSNVTPAGIAQVGSPLSALQPTLHFANGQLLPHAAPAPFKAAHSSTGLNVNQDGATVQARLNLFQVPCLDVKAHPIQVARNDILLSQLPQRIGPGKAEPIPTRWPHARFEQIPTRWPKLKVENIAGPAKTVP